MPRVGDCACCDRTYTIVSYEATFTNQVEKVSIEATFPKSVLSITLTPSQGRYSFDPTSRLMKWDIGEMEPGKIPSIRGEPVIVWDYTGSCRTVPPYLRSLPALPTCAHYLRTLLALPTCAPYLRYLPESFSPCSNWPHWPCWSELCSSLEIM